MRILLSFVAFSLLACGESKKDTTQVVDPTAIIPDFKNFEDSQGQLTSDGTRGVFVSQRLDGLYRVFSYDAAAQTKVNQFKSPDFPSASDQERLVAMTSDAAWLAIWRQSPTSSSIRISDWSGQMQATIDLPSDARVSGLAVVGAATPFAAGLDGFVAVSLRSTNGNVTEVYPISGNGSSISIAAKVSLTNEFQPNFAQDRTLYSSESIGSKIKVHARRYIGAAWVDSGQTKVLKSFEVERSYPTQAGLLYAANLVSNKLRPKSGSQVFSGTDVVTQVGVQDEVAVFNPYGNTSFSADSTSYKPYEPLSISSLSATSDASYVLVGGTDTYFCQNDKVLGAVTLTLVRVSDMATIPLLIARNPGETAWSQVISKPCEALDKGTNLEYDQVIVASKILGTDGAKFDLLYETKVSGDREIRFVEFTLDWASGSVQSALFKEISGNQKQ